MRSWVVKRSVVIGGHKISISLEDALSSHLKDIALARRATLSASVAKIDATREHNNLSSAVRLFVLEHCSREPSSIGRSPNRIVSLFKLRLTALNSAIASLGSRLH